MVDNGNMGWTQYRQIHYYGGKQQLECICKHFVGANNKLFGIIDRAKSKN